MQHTKRRVAGHVDNSVGGIKRNHSGVLDGKMAPLPTDEKQLRGLKCVVRAGGMRKDEKRIVSEDICNAWQWSSNSRRAPSVGFGRAQRYLG